MQITLENLSFLEPRLKFSTAFLVAIRVISYAFYFVFITTTIVFLFSDVEQLKWLGILFALYLLNKIIHIGKAERAIGEIKEEDIAKGINVSEFFSPKAFGFLERAFDKSRIFGGNFYLILLDNLINSKEVRIGLARLDVSYKDFSQKIDEAISSVRDRSAKSTATTATGRSVSNGVDNLNKRQSQEELMDKIGDLAKTAFLKSLSHHGAQVEPADLFSALGRVKDQELARIFYLFSVDAEDLENALIFSRFGRSFWGIKRLPKLLGGFASKRHKKINRRINRDWTARPTPYLDDFSVDLTDLALEDSVGFLIGHQKEYDRLVDILARSGRANVLLVGETGAGKEAIVNHLAFNVAKDKVSGPLFDKRLVALEVSALFSGADPAAVSERMKKIIDEVIKAGNIILYISDVHNLFKTSGEGHMSAADVLFPVLNSDAFQIVAATNPKDFKLTIETKTDFAGAFEVVRVEEINEDDATKILIYDSILLERDYRAIISFKAIKEAVKLAHKYFRQKLLPSSAQDLLRESLADTIARGDKILNADDIIKSAEKRINVPIHKAGEEESKKLLNLEKIIHQKLIDQEEAVGAVSRALREYRSGLSRKGGPMATFLFVGPTGVGKTELSKILSEIQFGSKEAMIRFDMSEYQDKQSIFRFIGAPDGSGLGALTQAVMEKPYSLILLDEFEKAHPDVLNLFLQVFDDGRLTDNLGRTVDFQNTIIIATSNAHSDFIKSSIEAGDTISKISGELKKKLTDFFKPELLNRFSNIIFFKNLSRDNIVAIAKLQLENLTKSVEDSNGVFLKFDNEAVKKIAELGYDPVFGARPLRGVISDKITSVLAEKILGKEIIRGDGIKVSIDKEEMIFNKA